MKTKLISVLIFTALCFIGPLLFKIQLIFTIQILALIIFTSIILCSQPEVTLSKSKEKDNDRSSVWLILGSGMLLHIAMVIEWAYFSVSPETFAFTPQAFVGILLVIGGTIYRVYSINILGRFFSSFVEIQNNHQIVDYGPYKYIRHPSYLGAYIAIIGAAVFMEATYSILFTAGLMLGVYHYRISHEEQTLENELGKAYIDYKNKTFRMIPFIY